MVFPNVFNLRSEIRRMEELRPTLVRRGVLSLGKARALAQMTRWDFEELLGQRGITRHDTRADLEEDIQYGFGPQ